MSIRRRIDVSVEDNFVAKSVGRRDNGVEFVATLGGSLPRRFASSNATSSWSLSPSLTDWALLT